METVQEEQTCKDCQEAFYFPEMRCHHAFCTWFITDWLTELNLCPGCGVTLLSNKVYKTIRSCLGKMDFVFDLQPEMWGIALGPTLEELLRDLLMVVMSPKGICTKKKLKKQIWPAILQLRRGDPTYIKRFKLLRYILRDIEALFSHFL